MRVRTLGVAAMAVVMGGPALAQEAAKPEPLAWSERVEPDNDYRGDFTAADPRVVWNGRQVPAKCTILPTNENDGFSVLIRQTSDNKIINLVNLSLTLEVGTGTCTDFKLIRASFYDPSAVLAPGDNGRVRFYSGGGDYVLRVLTIAREPEKDPFVLRVRKLDPSVKARKFEAGVLGLAASHQAAAASGAIDQARTAYLSMCAKGAEKLSASTCDAMRRDLEAAVAAQAATRREAEVMGVYRQLCAPGPEKLSKDTCATMLADAKRTLAAGPTPAAGPKAAAPRGKSQSAYDEFCRPGAEQVSAETCALLKEDADAGR